MERKLRINGEEASAFLVGLISKNVLAIDTKISSFLLEKTPLLESKSTSDYFDRSFDCDLYMPIALGGYSGRIDHAEKGEEWYSVIYIHNPPDLFVNGQPIKEIEFKTPIYIERGKGSKKRVLDPKNKFHLSLTSHQLPPEMTEMHPIFCFDQYQFLLGNNGKPNKKLVFQHGNIPTGFDIDVGDFELIAPVTQLLLSFMQNATPEKESSEQQVD